MTVHVHWLSGLNALQKIVFHFCSKTQFGKESGCRCNAPPSLLSPATCLAGRGPGCSGDTMLTDTASVKIRVFLVWPAAAAAASPAQVGSCAQPAGTSSQRCRHGRWVRTHTPAMHATCWDILSKCNNFFTFFTTKCHINVISIKSKIYSMLRVCTISPFH